MHLVKRKSLIVQKQLVYCVATKRENNIQQIDFLTLYVGIIC